MVDTNEHTGARLVSKVYSKQGADNFEFIFNNSEAIEKYFTGDTAEQEANEYLKEQGESHPEWEFRIQYTQDGLIILGKKIR